ncbi:MAG TPA: radical SAM protein, partial [Chitinivibrionales bacterium]
IPAASLADAIIRSGTVGVAYTYSEPYIWFETIMDIAPLVKNAGLKNVMVTNGFMEPAPLAKLLSVIDAMNIDIKSIRPDFYKKLCKAPLEPVLRTCETVKKKCHLEITNLIIPQENDTAEEIKDLACYIARNLGKDTPLHLSRYFPRYRMNTGPTGEDALLQAWKIAREELDFVYIGNAGAHDTSNTLCPSCSRVLIDRKEYSIKTAATLSPAPGGRGATCLACGCTVPIILN